MSAKVAKAWFKQHPSSVVSFHFRWAELPPSSREAMGLPRDARVSGNRVLFGPHRSEISLVGKTAKVTPEGELEISGPLGNASDDIHFVTYRAATS